MSSNATEYDPREHMLSSDIATRAAYWRERAAFWRMRYTHWRAEARRFVADARNAEWRPGTYAGAMADADAYLGQAKRCAGRAGRAYRRATGRDWDDVIERAAIGPHVE